MIKNRISVIFSAFFTFSLLISCESLPKNTDPNTIIYKDALNNIHSAPINHNVPKAQYDKSLFSKKHQIMSYVGDPNYTYRLGADISRHDGDIDWKKVKKSKLEFIIFRVGYRGYQTGILHVDEKFHQNIKAAMEAGFTDFGVYIFSQAINEKEAIEEAELVLNEIKEYPINLPVVFDPESILWEEARTDDITGEQFTKNTIAFCEHIKKAGYEPMVYSNLVWETEFFDLSQFSDYKIWYADYFSVPQTPYHFEYWQYEGTKLKVPGIKKRIDADIQLISVKDKE